MPTDLEDEFLDRLLDRALRPLFLDDRPAPRAAIAPLPAPPHPPRTHRPA